MLKYDSLSDDEKSITFVVQKTIKEPSYLQNNLRFKIESESSFGIKITAEVQQSQGYWGQTYDVQRSSDKLDVKRLNTILPPSIYFVINSVLLPIISIE